MDERNKYICDKILELKLSPKESLEHGMAQMVLGLQALYCDEIAQYIKTQIFVTIKWFQLFEEEQQNEDI